MSQASSVVNNTSILSGLSIQTDAGTASPSSSILQILGGTNVTTSAAGNIILIDASGSGTVTSVSGTVGRITSTGGATPIIDIDASYVGQTSLITLGNVTTGTWNADTIQVTKGGTGFTTSTQGDIIYSNAANSFAKLAKNTTATRYLSNTGASNNPAWAQVNLANGVTGTLTVSNGGTGQTTLTNHGVLVGAATSAITQLGTGSAGQVLQSGGAAADPAYSTATYPSTAIGTGTILRANGTNWVATTATYPTTTTINQILYSSANNTISEIATAIDGVLITSHTGVPSVLANSGTAGWVLTANSGAPPSWQAAAGGSAGTITGDSGGALSQSANNWNLLGSGSITTSGSGSTLTTQLTGLTNHALLVGAGSATITKLAVGSTGQFLQANTGADPGWSTATLPSTATGTGKILVADGTNWVASTPTYPNASAISRKIIVSDGTNFVASTETWATPSTSGNVLTSDGTNWVSSLPPLQTITKNITSTQIKALHGTPIQVIAAPGSGKIIVVVAQIINKYNYGGSNVFTAAASQTVALYYGTATQITTVASNAALVGTTSGYSSTNVVLSFAISAANIENLAVNLYNPIATEISGNAGNNNTVSTTIVYYIQTLT